MRCLRHEPPLLVYPSMLRTLVPPLRTYGFDIMVAIGILRWGLHLQRREVRLLLEARGIEISDGEVSALGIEFLLRFYLFHQSRSARIRQLLDSRPGTVFHADGTMDHGSEVVFTVMEGLTEIVLDSSLLPHEGKTEVAEALRGVRERFGAPDGLVRDLSPNVRDAMSEVFPGVPQNGCHVHFVRDLGGKLFDGSYGRFKDAVLDTKVFARLLDLGRRVSSDPATSLLERAVNAWIAREIVFIQAPRLKASRFPIILPYLECVSLAYRAELRVRRLVRALGSRNVSLRQLREVDDLLEKKLLPAIRLSYPLLATASQWYGLARHALRLSRTPLSASEPQEWLPADKARAQYLEALDRIEEESSRLGDDYRAIAGTIREFSRKHIDELFARVLAKDGSELRFRRENNIEESRHRWSRMNIRRRTGRGKTAREMTLFGPLLAVFSNLFNRAYVEAVLADVWCLAREFQAFPDNEVEGLRRKMQRCTKRGADPLVEEGWEQRSEELLAILESSACEGEQALEGWLKNLQDPVLTDD